MPERGWKVLTVREETAERIKKLAEVLSLSIDQTIKNLLKSG